MAFGSLSVIVLKILWIQHLNQGRRTIRKDSLGFWTCLFDAREDSNRRNPFLLPANVSQVFFVEDTGDPNWKVVVFQDRRSRRVIGPDARDPFRMDKDEMALETPLPEETQSASRT